MAKNLVIHMTQKGNFNNTFRFLKAMEERSWLRNLDKYGQIGVEALKAATPKNSGLTANSWKYEIADNGKSLYINWYNTNVVKGYFNVALMLQLGHGTKQGYWVKGVDYINPALAPVFDKIGADVWEEVKNS